MIYRCSTQNGAPPVMREYVASGAGLAGDIVTLGTDDGITVVGATPTAALGWATGDFADGDPVVVMEANDNTLVEMPFTGTVSAGMLGGFFGLAGDSGAQKVDLGNTTQKLVKLIKVTRNGADTGHAVGDTRCLVMIPSAKSQAVIES